MIEREAAVRIVEEQLERDYRRELSAGLDPMRMAVAHVEQHELVWIVSWTSEKCLRTRNPDFMLAGNGPYLIDRVDGGLHQVGVVSAATGAWEADYRVRIRSQAVRTAVDDLHEEVREVTAERGRIFAMHILRRRVPALSHAEVIDYVGALQNGAVPAHLVAISTEVLVEPLNPVLRVTTIRIGRGQSKPLLFLDVDGPLNRS
ncbi:YrhB domain-containing protein [Streptomyces sp. NBC_01800]|uniref:YrhB domain-containing protein n=1 Tax=Streptomyces sp. NBC_01800 TaxID=2975945 RepID=UPI002DDB8B97|nr:YrhB domain-containing protein [Streptomyces sp. NBC_01800]WSA73109.1 YrhB family protein [Streptomyces sp. NBC_01800]